MHNYKKPISGNKQDDRQRRNSAFTYTTGKVYLVATSIPDCYVPEAAVNYNVL